MSVRRLVLPAVGLLCLAAGCARGFQPKAMDRLRAGMVIGEVADALGPPDYITSALRHERSAAETWQYGMKPGKGKAAASYCVEFVDGRLLTWRRSDTPAGQGCSEAGTPP